MLCHRGAPCAKKQHGDTNRKTCPPTTLFLHPETRHLFPVELRARDATGEDMVAMGGATGDHSSELPLYRLRLVVAGLRCPSSIAYWANDASMENYLFHWSSRPFPSTLAMNCVGEYLLSFFLREKTLGISLFRIVTIWVARNGSLLDEVASHVDPLWID